MSDRTPNRLPGRKASCHGQIWWLLLRPEFWTVYAYRAAFFAACRPLLYGPPWEDCQ